MTNEEAIELIECGDISNRWGKDGEDVEKMAIKALEQQPCEDAISRQAVHDLIAELLSDYLHDEDREKIEELDVKIEDLEPVTPKEKTGHWRPIEYDGYADGSPVWDVWECSECGWEHNGDEESLTAFCPNCGAKMVEPQVSEDKE